MNASTKTSTRQRIHISVLFKMNKPEICPKNTANNGRMTTADNCSATRGSLTRDDTMMAKFTESTAISGPAMKMAVSHIGSSRAEANAPPPVMMSEPTAKIAKPTQVAKTAGMTEARFLPVSSSPVVMGVANRGSRLRVVFSPTMD